ncbi:acyl-CoA thioesterase [Haloferula rosea]|uniref:Acyl-CoA thioesterase n=1 Tax=Haloferula rosea TaxID=490093 RepID=A0A934RE74_9BACT|nr:thioesterase family protein [Haloferula rosea]MBK1826785.1 acyl-CoA thioesterase [Haloferula rosea]
MSTPAHQIKRRVEFYETDMAGIVHFTNFFRFMEACEHDFLRTLDHELHGVVEGLETGWPRVNATCDYRAPARFGDELTVSLFVEEVRNRSVRYRFDITKGDTLVAEGRLSVAHVAMTEDGIKAVPLPGELKEKLDDLK